MKKYSWDTPERVARIEARHKEEKEFLFPIIGYNKKDYHGEISLENVEVFIDDVVKVANKLHVTKNYWHKRYPIWESVFLFITQRGHIFDPSFDTHKLYPYVRQYFRNIANREKIMLEKLENNNYIAVREAIYLSEHDIYEVKHFFYSDVDYDYSYAYNKKETIDHAIWKVIQKNNNKYRYYGRLDREKFFNNVIFDRNDIPRYPHTGRYTVPREDWGNWGCDVVGK